MKKILVEPVCAARPCKISLKEFSSETAGGLSESIVIITDSNVRQCLGDRFPDAPVIELEPGEASKDLAKVKEIYQRLMELGADRSTLILGVGGGVVCDIAGFVGSTFKRGLDFGFFPTTLLAQVDAAIGGKNGVNMGGFKNQLGTVVQPTFVNIDVSALETLPEEEFRNGLAEVVKTAALGDSVLFGLLENESERVLAKERMLLEGVVFRCASAKAHLVNSDEREEGIRAVLNFGHTIGHALESTKGLSHGEGVAIGMVQEAGIAVKLGRTSQETADRIRTLLVSFGLPVELDIEPSELSEAINRDKKNFTGILRFPVITEIGRAELVDIPLERFKERLNDLR